MSQWFGSWFGAASAACDYPAESDVRLGVAYDAFTGTLGLPAESDVRRGVGYGAGGAEFTGTLSASGGSTPDGPHSPAYVVRQLLVDLGLGGDSPSLPWPCYACQEPPEPDDCLTVYDTAGQPDGRLHTGETAEHDGVQVRVRSSTPQSGWAKAREVALALDAVSLAAVAVGAWSYRVRTLSRTGTVLALGKDAPGSKRSLHTLDLLASLCVTE